MIDLHAHMLPGLDDGPVDLEKAVAMATMAAADGITHVVVSPHAFNGVYRNTRDEILNSVNALQEALTHAGVMLRILPGMEAHVHPHIGERLRMGEVQTINHSRYLLLELPDASIPFFAEHLMSRLVISGITPVLIHPERNVDIQQDPNVLLRFLEQGVLAVASADSLRGTTRPIYQETVKILLTHSLVQGVASDAHGLTHRPPVLSDVRKTVARMCGETHTRMLFDTFPKQIIQNQDPEYPDPIPVQKRKHWLSWR